MNFTRKNIVLFISSIAILLVSLCAGPAAFGKGQQLVSESIKGTNFTIDIPAGWKQGAISGKSILLCRSPDGGLYPNINIAVMQQEYDSLQDAHKNVVGLLPNPQIFQEEQVTVNGIPGYFSAITWMSPLGGLKALRLLVQDKEQHILLITYVGRDSKMTAEDVQLYLKSINSIR